MNGLVSIMIPTYNQRQYIEQAVKSALAQDYPNLEVIVSDDSTNDDTRYILEPYFSDNRFRYSKNERSLGRVGNYRKLLNELANGEWVVMLDGDDYYIDDQYISKAMTVAGSDKDIILVGAAVKTTDEATQESKVYGLGKEDFIIDGKLIFTVYRALPNHQTDIYVKKLAQQLNFYRHPSTGSDSESLFRLCLHGKVAYIAREVAVWRIHDSNTTYTRNISQQVKELTFIDSIYEYALKHLHRAEAGKWRRNMYRGMSVHLFDLSLSAKQYWPAIWILLRFGKFLGLRQTISRLRQLVVTKVRQ